MKLNFNFGHYEGDVKNNIPHGYGTFYYENSTYQGIWQNFKWHGNGIYINKDLTYYGEFKESVFHGDGCMCYKHGTTLFGKWENGIPSGIMTVYTPNHIGVRIQIFNGDIYNHKLISRFSFTDIDLKTKINNFKQEVISKITTSRSHQTQSNSNKQYSKHKQVFIEAIQLYREGQYQAALLLFSHALELNNEPKFANLCYEMIANCERNLGEIKFDSLQNQAIAYVNQGEYNKAIAILNQMIRLCDNEIAKNKYNNILQYIIGLKNNNDTNYESVFHQEETELDEPSHDSPYREAEESNEDLNKAIDLYNTGIWYYERGKYLDALIHFEDALKSCNSYDDEFCKQCSDAIDACNNALSNEL